MCLLHGDFYSIGVRVFGVRKVSLIGRVSQAFFSLAIRLIRHMGFEQVLGTPEARQTQRAMRQQSAHLWCPRGLLVFRSPCLAPRLIDSPVKRFLYRTCEACGPQLRAKRDSRHSRCPIQIPPQSSSAEKPPYASDSARSLSCQTELYESPDCMQAGVKVIRF